MRSNSEEQFPLQYKPYHKLNLVLGRVALENRCCVANTVLTVEYTILAHRDKLVIAVAGQIFFKIMQLASMEVVLQYVLSTSQNNHHHLARSEANVLSTSY